MCIRDRSTVSYNGFPRIFWRINWTSRNTITFKYRFYRFFLSQFLSSDFYLCIDVGTYLLYTHKCHRSSRYTGISCFPSSDEYFSTVLQTPGILSFSLTSSVRWWTVTNALKPFFRYVSKTSRIIFFNKNKYVELDLQFKFDKFLWKFWKKYC